MFRSDDLNVTFLGDVWAVSNPCAHDWLLAVHADPDGLTRVFPGFLAQERVEDMVALLDRATDAELQDLERRWRNVARVVLGRATGREWWRATNLIKVCMSAWTGVNGSLLLSGCDGRRMPLDSWLDAAYVHLMRSNDDEGRQKLEFELTKKPKGVVVAQNSMSIKNALAKFAAD